LLNNVTKKQRKFLSQLELEGWTCKYTPRKEGGCFFGLYYKNIWPEECLELSVNSFEELAERIDDWYESYDPDYETYLWLGPDGHGRNGAPYHIRELLDHFEEYEEKLKELSRKFYCFVHY